jgi:hypothetical protein
MKDTVLASVSLVTCLAFRALADQSPVGDHHGGNGDLLSRSFGQRAAIKVTLNQIFGEPTFDYNLQEQTMISRHTATEYQRRIAERNAEVFFKHLPPAKKLELEKKHVHSVLIPTVRSPQTSPKAKQVMMPFNFKGDLMENSVYEFEAAQKANTIIKVEGREEYISE